LGHIGVPVPNGFAVSADAYRFFLEETGATEKIHGLVSGVDVASIESLQDVSQKIREYVEGLAMPKEMGKAILDAYQALCKKAGKKTVAVAVRSSATAEDLPGASFAGQQDTFLNRLSERIPRSLLRG
jgi:pyruvate,water dikinase